MVDLSENLVFLISLPRSGSTLLQHILAGHSSVAATAEPWVLFPAIYGLRQGELRGNYNTRIGEIALNEFVAQLEDGEEQYYAAVRKMALHLYDAYMSKHKSERFLDKTSRYYLVLPELFRTFPRAKYVFLLRNPLAVLASFLEHMVFGNWKRLGEPGIRDDLLDGYGLVRHGIRYFGDDAIVLKYEDLVEDPETTVAHLCKSLGLGFEPEMINYGERVGVLPGKLVDPKSIQQHQRPVKEYADAWRSKFTTRQRRNLAQAFLDHLGQELIDSLGYSYDELAAAVSGVGRGWAPVVGWHVLMRPPDERSVIQRWMLEIACVWQERGGVAVLTKVTRHIVNALLSPLGAAWRVVRSRAKSLPGVQSVQRRVRINLREGILASSLSATEQVSSNYEVVDDRSQLDPVLSQGWRSPSIAERQCTTYAHLLEEMYEGNPRQDLVAAAQALRLTGLPNPTVLEIGCGNGYYSEVLTYLAHRPVGYTGLDYSAAMIRSARESYEEREFVVGDATMLPFKNDTFEIGWSGTVLMHLVDYEEAIAEACRVARRFCVFHSTPVLSNGQTTFLSKKAYGEPVAEVIINQDEFEHLLHRQGFVIRHVLESLPYEVDSVVSGTVHTLTYVCERHNAK